MGRTTTTAATTTTTTGEGDATLAARRELALLLDAVGAVTRDLLAHEDDPPDDAPGDPGTLAARLDLALGEHGHDPGDVVAGVARILRATPSSSSRRFLNQLFGGRVPAATAAEMLAAVPSISMYTFKAAGAMVLAEREVLARLLAKAGLPGGEATMTPGGSAANLVAMLLARQRAAPDAREHGLDGPPLVAYTSAEGHYSVPKAAGILGVGRANLRRIPATADGGMDASALATAVERDLAAGRRPFLVNATAGTTVRGAFDPLRPIAALCRRHEVWLHVDGALGGSLVLSRTHRRLADGVELADSFAWNLHKMLGVPLPASVLLVARRGDLAATLDEAADYLFQSGDDDLDPGHRSLQCGRRADALKVWAAWRRLGDRGLAERVDRQLALARRAAELIAADPALELLEPPPSVTVCFVVRGRSSETVCERLDAAGILKIGHGAVGERRAIRLVCVNPDLGDDDLRQILEDVKAAAAEA